MQLNTLETVATIDNQQTPYALAKLAEASRIIKQSITELPVIRKRLDKYKDNKRRAREVYIDLQQQYGRLLGAFGTAALALLEIDMPDVADYSVKLRRSIEKFNLMTPDYTKLCAALNGYIVKLPQTTNKTIIGRLMNDVRMGYYPTEQGHVRHIARGIEFPTDVTPNLFDPCCGCGLALHTLAKDNNCNTYGVELDSHRAEESLTRLNRVGFGSYYHSRVSHEAFHLMLLNPPYLWTMTEGGNNTRSEKRFLVTIRPLMI